MRNVESGDREEELGRDVPVSLSQVEKSKNANVFFVGAVVLNVILLLISHLGTSGVVESNLGALAHQPSDGGVNGRDLFGRNAKKKQRKDQCLNDQDAAIFRLSTVDKMIDLLMDCNLRGKSPCFAQEACVAKCVAGKMGYTLACGYCFGDASACTLNHCINPNGECLNAAEPACRTCVRAHCESDFLRCSGLDLPQPESVSSSTTDTKGQTNDKVVEKSSPQSSPCKSLEPLYRVQFIDAVQKAWNGGAKLLAVTLGIASGVWPYVKNIMILAVWFRPMQINSRRRILSWLSRLGKWSYVDVFIMVLLNATLKIEKQLSSNLLFLVLSYPRTGIFSFCIAATLSIIQCEYLKLQHDEYVITWRQQHRKVSTSLTNGMLRSNWRRALAENIAQSRLLDRRTSLIIRILLPVLTIACLAIGIFSLNAIRYSLEGTMALLPGNNIYTFSIDEVMRSIVATSGCSSASASEPGKVLLFATFYFMVLIFPTVVCISTAFFWVSRSGSLAGSTFQSLVCWSAQSSHARPHYYQPNGAGGLATTVDMCSSFASLDVFVVSMFIVAYEIDKVVRAVGEAAQVSGINVDLEVKMLPGGYLLVVGVFLYWLMQAMYLIEDNADFLATSAASKASGGMFNSSPHPPTIFEEEDEFPDEEDDLFVASPASAEESKHMIST